MTRTHTLVSALGAGALSLAALLLPAAGAQATTLAADSCTQNWSISSGEGYANGKWCNYNTKVTGTVHDTKADGRCPFVRGVLSNGGVVDGDWATGKGTSRGFTLDAPSGYFTSVQMKYITC
ncbi:hypothetical protein GCM10020229_55400 [Kitasatospora albolonga]|uniref:hypothetical protein n=1 Tax=Kitasatospora albolonga TaxID=68173 RepID=UPI0031EE0308